MDTPERRLSEAICTHGGFNALHADVTDWVAWWVASTWVSAPEGEPPFHHVCQRIWTGDDFKKARAETFPGCILPCRRFAEDVLICLSSDIDPASMLILEESPTAQ